MLKQEKDAKKRLRNAELAEKARDRLEKWIAENESNDAIAQSKCSRKLQWSAQYNMHV